MGFTDYKNIHHMLKEAMEFRPERVVYTWFTDSGTTESVSCYGFYIHVRQAAKALMSLDVGRDQKVGILANTCYNWVVSDFAATCIGACTVGIYQSNPAAECLYVLEHSDTVVLIVENEDQLSKIKEIKDQLPLLRKVILLNGRSGDLDWVISFDDFLDLGNNIGDDLLNIRIAEIKSSDIAGIVYTSGTTGPPKGAMLTHDNITFTAQSVAKSANFPEHSRTFLFLPLAHVFARAVVYAALYEGVNVCFSRSTDTILEDIKRASPDWFAAVPRVFEKIYSSVMGKAESSSGLKRSIFDWALKTGKEVSELKEQQKVLPGSLKFQYELASILVFNKLKKLLGGRVAWCVSGSAPLNVEVARFFHGAGVLILEGFGMTENSSFSNINREDGFRFGWVGPPGPGIEQKVSDDGQIMFRGRNVMKGYYKMPVETKETIDEDGWLLTGDVGVISDDNFLKITRASKGVDNNLMG